MRTKEKDSELTSSSISGSIKETKLSTSFWPFNHCNTKNNNVNTLQNTNFMITAEILTRLLANNFCCQYADRHMNL